ncbi:MAG: DUF1592 domain-containing protein [Myxococcota bacterium]
MYRHLFVAALVLGAGCDGVVRQAPLDHVLDTSGPGDGRSELVCDDEPDQDPGVVTLRRLSRVELDNTLSSLVGTEHSTASLFPDDAIGYGFDNIGTFQSISPVVFEAYYDSAETSVVDVLGAPAALLEQRYESELLQAYLPNGFEVGLVYQDTSLVYPVTSYTPSPDTFVFKDATYRVRFNAAGVVQNMLLPPKVSIRFGTQPAVYVDVSSDATFADYSIDVEVDAEVGQLEIGLFNGFTATNFMPLYQPLTSCTDLNGAPDECANNGTGDQCVADLCRIKTACVSDADCPGTQHCGTVPNHCPPGRGCCVDPGNQTRLMAVDWFQVEELGTPPPPNPLRDAVVECDPETLGAPQCARQVFSAFGTQAWRRPLTGEELDRLLALAELAWDQGEEFSVGVDLGLEAILLSPNFMFRVELDADPGSGESHPLSDYELASRLSYFLWSGPPDEALLSLAEAGTLGSDEVLNAQIDRMLASPRAQELHRNFGGQWLFVRELDHVAPSSEIFPDFDESLRAAMKSELGEFFASFQNQDRDLRELFTTTEFYLNDRLAQHYGVEAVGSEKSVPISVETTGRVGILGMSGVHTLTSAADHTSVTKRGKWILGQFFCDEPPPPPPDVEGLAPNVDPTAPTRVQLAQHRENPTCAGCHLYMDPLGLSLEHFDAVGRYRSLDENGHPADDTAELPDGRVLDGIAELGPALAEDPEVQRCVVEQMLTYAVGRGFVTKDTCGIEALRTAWADGSYRYSALVRAIVLSPYFRTRRGTPSNGGTP